MKKCLLLLFISLSMLAKVPLRDTTVITIGTDSIFITPDKIWGTSDSLTLDFLKLVAPYGSFTDSLYTFSFKADTMESKYWRLKNADGEVYWYPAYTFIPLEGNYRYIMLGSSGMTGLGLTTTSSGEVGDSTTYIVCCNDEGSGQIADIYMGCEGEDAFLCTEMWSTGAAATPLKRLWIGERDGTNLDSLIFLMRGWRIGKFTPDSVFTLYKLDVDVVTLDTLHSLKANIDSLIINDTIVKFEEADSHLYITMADGSVYQCVDTNEKWVSEARVDTISSSQLQNMTNINGSEYYSIASGKIRYFFLMSGTPHWVMFNLYLDGDSVHIDSITYKLGSYGIVAGETLDYLIGIARQDTSPAFRDYTINPADSFTILETSELITHTLDIDLGYSGYPTWIPAIRTYRFVGSGIQLRVYQIIVYHKRFLKQ